MRLSIEIIMSTVKSMSEIVPDLSGANSTHTDLSGVTIQVLSAISLDTSHTQPESENKLIINLEKMRTIQTKLDGLINEERRIENVPNFLFIDKVHDPKSTVRFDPKVLDEEKANLNLEDKKNFTRIRGYDDIKHTMDTKFGYKEGQLSSTLDIVAMYMRGQKILYLEAKAYCEFYLWRLMVPTIFISTICSVISGILSTNQNAIISVAVFSGFNTILLALINYFKLDARAEAHRMTAYSFDQLISECEFASGKILLCNPTSSKDETKHTESQKESGLIIYDIKYIQTFLDEFEKKVKEVKQKNQFLIPDIIRRRYHKIYNTNIFTHVKKIQLEEMILLNKLKVAHNACTDVENRIIRGNRSPEVYEEYNFKYKQKQDMFEHILQKRKQALDLPKDLEDQITGFPNISHISCLSIRRLFCYY
jgi:hypothetical protein